MKIIIQHTDPNGLPRVSTVTINDAEAVELSRAIAVELLTTLEKMMGEKSPEKRREVRKI